MPHRHRDLTPGLGGYGVSVSDALHEGDSGLLSGPIESQHPACAVVIDSDPLAGVRVKNSRPRGHTSSAAEHSVDVRVAPVRGRVLVPARVWPRPVVVWLPGALDLVAVEGAPPTGRVHGLDRLVEGLDGGGVPPGCLRRDQAPEVVRFH